MSARMFELALGPASHSAGDGLWTNVAQGTTDDGAHRQLEGDVESSPSQPARVCSMAGNDSFLLSFEAERDYWLNGCVGFAVEAEGRINGRVALLKYRSRADRPDVLVIQQSPLVGHRFSLRAEDVRAVDPWRERVYVWEQPSTAVPRLARRTAPRSSGRRGTRGREDRTRAPRSSTG